MWPNPQFPFLWSGGYGLNDIFISAMICRRSKVFNWEGKPYWFFKEAYSKENEYFFIDNGNIEIRDLRKDNVHLLE